MMIGTIPFCPPNESRSVSLSFTRGCCNGHCSFCNSQGAAFQILSPVNARRMIAAALAEKPDARKIYFSGEDSIALPQEYLLDAIGYIRWLRPEVDHISIGAKTQSLLMKTQEELEELKMAGVRVVYHYIISGDQRVLDSSCAGVNVNEMKVAAWLVKSAGLKLVEIILTGLSSLCAERSAVESAAATALCINEISPDEVIAIPCGNGASFDELKNIVDEIDIHDGWLTACGAEDHFIRVKLPENRYHLAALLSETAEGNEICENMFHLRTI